MQRVCSRVTKWYKWLGKAQTHRGDACKQPVAFNIQPCKIDGMNCYRNPLCAVYLTYVSERGVAQLWAIWHDWEFFSHPIFIG